MVETPVETPAQTPRQLALNALRAIQAGAFADVALDKLLQTTPDLAGRDRSLVTELTYGCVRRQRTLDALIDHYAQQPKALPPELRLILRLGFYQLVFLDHIPESAAVNTCVDLAKHNRLAGLGGLVNGILRAYLRDRPANTASANTASAPELGDRLLPLGPDLPLGVRHSYPDWIIQVWLDQFGPSQTEALCLALNQTPHLDLRVNTRRASREQVMVAFTAAGIETQTLDPLPQGVRLLGKAGAIQALPGFREGWWVVQDASAQLVGYLLAPNPTDVVVDACAAPGGKTLHIAELMNLQAPQQDSDAPPAPKALRGELWACDRTPSRLRKIQQSAARLGIEGVQLQVGDSREFSIFTGRCDRVLVDAPCSGLGTLHRHADARWRQTPEMVEQLAQLQLELLTQAATWLKPQGLLVYSTCTLHERENEQVVQAFLQAHPTWSIAPIPPESPAAAFAQSNQPWIKICPQLQGMDGFFMVGLRLNS
jgi:16S rRNA (cytosine967-C5)-methyltransferase